MKRAKNALTAVAGAIVVIAGCESSPRDGDAGVVSTSSEPDRPRRRSLSGVQGIMVEKLDHAQALLSAISLDAYGAVERHATALTDLSRRSDWQVHSTLAYDVFSEQFREATTALASDARAQNREAVADDYLAMVRSCLDCHGYLRREGLIGDRPGRITMLLD